MVVEAEGALVVWVEPETGAACQRELPPLPTPFHHQTSALHHFTLLHCLPIPPRSQAS